MVSCFFLQIRSQFSAAIHNHTVELMTLDNVWVSLPPYNVKVVDVDGGSNHSGFVTDDGDVYTWGMGYAGCLGHGNFEAVMRPKRVDYFHKHGLKAVAIACGGHVTFIGGLTLVLLDDNRLFCWGIMGTDKYQTLPMHLVVPCYRILSISTGDDWAGVVAYQHQTVTDRVHLTPKEKRLREARKLKNLGIC